MTTHAEIVPKHISEAADVVCKRIVIVLSEIQVRRAIGQDRNERFAHAKATPMKGRILRPRDGEVEIDETIRHLSFTAVLL